MANAQGSLRDDEALASRAKAGDREAFGELMRRYAPVVGRQLAAMTDRAEVVEDLVQDTFVQAWAALPRYRSQAFGAWIRQIALNCGRQMLRSAWQRRVTLHDDQAEVGPLASAATDESEAPYERALRAERAERIRTAIGHLPRAQGEAVRLRYLMGESLAAIAAVLGVPEGTVRSRIHAALPRLRAELADYFQEFDR